MTLTRWKLLAGVFGISVCGFAALAEPACRTVGTAANRHEPAEPDAKAKGSVDAKPKADVPPPALPVPETPTVAPAVIPLIAFEAKPTVGVTTPAEAPVAATPVPAFTGPLVTPEQFVKDLVPPPVPLPSPIPAPSPPAPTPAPTPPAPTPAPLPEPGLRQVEASKPVATASDKKLKVNLQMDEGNPKFEVRDGEEVVLKVVSNKVDVASATNERGSTLKACGQVKFAMPGGDGSCDTLQVMPGTGEILAIGNVTFRYNWGKVETSASAEKMNFRLGTMPGTKQ